MYINSMNVSNWLGLLLSIFFTSIPFCMIYYNFFEKNTLLIITIFCAIIQIYIHLVFFLHLGHMLHAEWNIISLIFTIFILFILILGSIWIMTHLHHNLMTYE